MKKAVTGSCLCGHIKYTMDLDIGDDGSMNASRCNCTFCLKPGLTNTQLADPASFKLVSPASRSDVGNYNPNERNAHKYFCRSCGCHVWAEGEYEYGGQLIEFFTVNLASVDQPQDGVDLSKVKLQYWDGRNDNWAAGQKQSAFAGGLP